MQFLRCDSCGKPLGEGALGRGDASKRGELLICRNCLRLEEAGATLPISPPEDRALLWQKHSRNEARGLDTEPLPNTEHLEAIPNRPSSQRASSARAVASAQDGELIDILLNDNTRLRGRVHRNARGKLVIYEEPSSTKSIVPPSQTRASQRSSARLPHSKQSSASGIQLPSRRSNPARAMTPAENAAHALPTGAKKGNSPLLGAAILLLIIVVPAFAVSLYNMIENSKLAEQLKLERDEAAMRLEEAKAQRNRPIDRSGLSAEQRRNSRVATPTDEELEAAKRDQAARREREAGTPELDPARPLPLSSEAQEHLNTMERNLARPLLNTDGLGSDDLGTRLIALREIAKRRAVSAASAVVILLESPHAVERQLAASVLGELAWYPANQTLSDMAQLDPVVGVRNAAQRSLAQLGGNLTSLDLAEFTEAELENLRNALIEEGGQEGALKLIEREMDRRKNADPVE